MAKKIIVTDIEYDTDGLKVKLPKTLVIEIPDVLTDKEEIEEFISDEQARIKYNLGKDVRDWQVNFARNDLQKNYPDNGKLCRISYRPFDYKWTFYTGNSKGFHCYPRNEVMQHFFNGENVGLVFKKGNAEENSASI